MPRRNVNLTGLGYKNEQAILDDLDPIIKKWAKKLDVEQEVLCESIAYLWADSRRSADRAVLGYLSENEIGIFGGR